MQRLSCLFVITLGVSWAFLGCATPAAAASPQCFGAVDDCINDHFLDFWEQNGGLAGFGYPITAARLEANRDTGQLRLTQWFERGRLELHNDHAEPYNVLLGRLGDDRLLQQGIAWRQLPR